MMYDYLIVGTGLFGSTCAYELSKRGYNVLVIDKRDHVGGNIYTSKNSGIVVHEYGAHIFHTDNLKIWKYINQFAKFNDFINSPIADYHGERYHLPFNMNTFCEIWNDVKTPEDAKKRINDEKQKANITNPTNLEEQAICLVGTTIYKKLVKEYTEKQWGRKCSELPADIIKRLPLRFEFNNNYFNDRYQGIPIGGYTNIIKKMLRKSSVLLSTNFFGNRNYFESISSHIIFTGPIDEYYDYVFGNLEYRSLRFVKEKLNIKDFQGNAVINYTSNEKEYTRIIEHKHFEYGAQSKTIITREYPTDYCKGAEPYYPINDSKNNSLYSKYEKLSSLNDRVYFGGRLGTYKYLDMDDTIEAALELINKIMEKNNG